jgi:uncharacterized protein YjbI with pentapeptide repeats
MSPVKNPPRPPLTDEERRLLIDPAYFAVAAAQGPIVLKDRSVENLEIHAHIFSSVRWTGVDFQSTKFSATIFAAAELSEVTFSSCRFADVVFEHSRLDQCAFELAELERVRLVDSATNKLAFTGCVWKDAVFERCQFESATDLSSTFVHTRLHELHWNACAWHGTRFDHAQVGNVTMTGGSFAGVTFTDAQGSSFLVQSTLVDGLDFVLGTWVALTFDQIHGRSLRLTEVAATGFSLLGCGELVGVAVAGGSVTGLAIDRCPALGLVGLAYTDIRGFTVTDSLIDGAFWQRCSLADDSSIERTVLAGLNLGQSTLDGVTIRDTEFTVALALDMARIQGLSLENIRYAPDLELRSDGVIYGPGARFPTP